MRRTYGSGHVTYPEFRDLFVPGSKDGEPKAFVVKDDGHLAYGLFWKTNDGDYLDVTQTQRSVLKVFRSSDALLRALKTANPDYLEITLPILDERNLIDFDSLKK